MTIVNKPVGVNQIYINIFLYLIWFDVIGVTVAYMTLGIVYFYLAFENFTHLQ